MRISEYSHGIHLPECSFFTLEESALLTNRQSAVTGWSMAPENLATSPVELRPASAASWITRGLDGVYAQ
ncbi:hypothetical protein [Kitasatospora mediocidica]|uniref:hypothetical protein n=1 Tax=Kitasatospora mediocidica TaxID=58352 RepID=UPI0012F7F1C4|nr:hypothetical protein [Kitasatospora mediocidica]